MSRLENWSVYNGSLVGDVYDDNRFPDGKRVITTRLVSINFEENSAKTENTTYQLGAPENAGTIVAEGEIK